MPVRHDSPLVIEVTRGRAVESSHLVDAMVVDEDGQVVAGWGDARRRILPRSAVKPIQALPLIDTGAADGFGLTDVEVALTCSSHGGEPEHIAVIERWLSVVGLAEEALECGAHPPLHGPSAAQLIRAGLDPGPRHNNCSGQHLGFLTICQHRGYPLSGYIDPDHPLQRDHVTPAIKQLCRLAAGDQTPMIDGCGIPVWAIPLDDLARGWAALATHRSGLRLLGSMRSEPFYVAGSTRACTRIIEAAGGDAVVKTGSEGVLCGVVPDQGLGIALKVRDGGQRAAEATIEWLLHQLGVISSNRPEPMANWAGVPVGEIRVRP